MKPGDIVTVYEDPLTEQRPWFTAKLLEVIIADSGIFEGRTQQFWKVRIKSGPRYRVEPGEDENAEVWILAPV